MKTHDFDYELWSELEHHHPGRRYYLNRNTGNWILSGIKSDRRLKVTALLLKYGHVLRAADWHPKSEKYYRYSFGKTPEPALHENLLHWRPSKDAKHPTE
ncbi:MAG: hypothetical protein LRZ84_10500 [Desertifilum sp.]|nr:hypothetical protein [Desertifilum sp.]